MGNKVPIFYLRLSMLFCTKFTYLELPILHIDLKKFSFAIGNNKYFRDSMYPKLLT